MSNRLSTTRRDALLAALAGDTVVAVARRLAVDLNVAYAWDSRRLRGVCACGSPLHSGECKVAPTVLAAIRRDRIEQNLGRSALAAKYGVSLDVVTRATTGVPYRGRRSPVVNDWTEGEHARLRALYATALSMEEIYAAFPARTRLAVQRRASFLGLNWVRRQAEIKVVEGLSPEVMALRQRRLELGLSQAELAERVSFPRSTLAAYEVAHFAPTPERAALGVGCSALQGPLERVPAIRVALPPVSTSARPATPQGVVEGKPTVPPVREVQLAAPLARKSARSSGFSMMGGRLALPPRRDGPRVTVELDPALGARSLTGCSMEQ